LAPNKFNICFPGKAVLDATIYFSGPAPAFLELGQNLRNTIDRGDALAARCLHLQGNLPMLCADRLGLELLFDLRQCRTHL
jgi:hypothetical protein